MTTRKARPKNPDRVSSRVIVLDRPQCFPRVRIENAAMQLTGHKTCAVFERSS
jgi:hypothetical protein